MPAPGWVAELNAEVLRWAAAHEAWRAGAIQRCEFPGIIPMPDLPKVLQPPRPHEHAVLLSDREHAVLEELAQALDLSKGAVLRQGLRVLQLQQAGKLVAVESGGGCGGED